MYVRTDQPIDILPNYKKNEKLKNQLVLFSLMSVYFLPFALPFYDGPKVR